MNNASDKTIFFHVGMPKTASTFLQRNVFPKFDGIHFVKKHDFKHRDRIIPHSSHDRILLSIELNLDSKGGISKVKDVAEKYPNTHPIIVLRKHGPWLRSKYKYYLRKHGDRHFEDYFNLKDSGYLDTNNLLFFPKIRFLEEQFGKRPLVLFMEELKENPYGVIDLLANHMGATYAPEQIQIETVKKSYSAKQLRVVREFNRAYRYDHSHIQNKTRKFAYKKFGGMLLHSVAYLSLLIPNSLMKSQQLIPPEKIREVEEAYENDWQQCIEYARQERKLLSRKIS